VVSVYSGDGKAALRFTGLILLSLVAYLVPASLEVKHYFYGGVIYGCVAVCLILTIHFLTDRHGPFFLLHQLRHFRLTDSSVQNFRTGTLILLGLLAKSAPE
jgi:hypothetical protein